MTTRQTRSTDPDGTAAGRSEKAEVVADEAVTTENVTGGGNAERNDGVEGNAAGGNIAEDNTAGAATAEGNTAGAGTAEARRRTKALRQRMAGQLLFELVLPLGSYYGLRAAGAGQWLALVAGGLLVLPWIAYGIVRQRRVETMAVFTLSLVVVGGLLSMITGDPRVLLLRDSWLTGAIGLWVLGSLFTRRPFMMTASRGIVIAKVGEAGLVAWEARWDAEPTFRHHLRLLTAVWGGGILFDAVLRVALVYSIPVDAFPLTSTVLWLVLLGGLFTFHYTYITRNGLKL
ncbi:MULTISPECIES: septation protein IspZ [unclassified Streptomyces]|uniref:septation protein IspZ n=1 Tax=unclassified Streptomyces TaxID=2593676 RepID=UPI001F1AC4CF|nr:MULTISPECIES: septation protein IspZ [unclassified Streptomyces]